MAISPNGVAPAVVFRDAHFEDYEAIASVQFRNGLTAKPLEQWKHLWIENPVYKNLTQWHDGWVAENADGKIVGYVGHVPLSYEFGGRQIVAACAHGLSIDAVHRGYGVHLLKRHLSDKYTDVVLTSTASPDSAPLLDVLCSRVPTGNWGEAAFWITNHHGFAASVLRTRHWPQWLSWPASAALAPWDRVSNPLATMRTDGKSEIKICSNFDERFDTFWESLKRAYPDRFLATRSREVLQWHFKYALAQRQRLDSNGRRLEHQRLRHFLPRGQSSRRLNQGSADRLSVVEPRLGTADPDVGVGVPPVSGRRHSHAGGFWIPSREATSDRQLEAASAAAGVLVLLLPDAGQSPGTAVG